MQVESCTVLEFNNQCDQTMSEKIHSSTKNSFVMSLLKIGAFAVLVLLWFMYLRSNHPTYWKSIHSQIIAPFQRWPRELTSFGSYGAYIYSIGAVLIVDFIVLKKNSALARIASFRPSIRVDLILGAIAILGFAWVIPGIVTAGFSAILPRFFSKWKIDLIADIPSDFLKLLVYFVAVDFLVYWHHRALHKFQPLWEFHAFHHSATSFTIFTGNRVHPMEFILKIPMVVVPMLFFGAAPGVLVNIWYIRRIFDMAQHSYVPFTYGWLGKWVVFSPIGHRIHHSTQVEHFDSNFGDIFPIWDHIFGTWYSGDEINEKIGIPENEFNKDGVVADLYRPFKKTIPIL